MLCGISQVKDGSLGLWLEEGGEVGLPVFSPHDKESLHALAGLLDITMQY